MGAKKSDGFTKEERAAMRERAKEQKEQDQQVNQMKKVLEELKKRVDALEQQGQKEK